MTIREKMARAIAVERDVDPDEHIDVFGNKAWTWYTHEAEAALSVLTNPDDETVERLAGRIADEAVGCCCISTKEAAYLTRAILAALKEEV